MPGPAGPAEGSKIYQGRQLGPKGKKLVRATEDPVGWEDTTGLPTAAEIVGVAAEGSADYRMVAVARPPRSQVVPSVGLAALMLGKPQVSGFHCLGIYEYGQPLEVALVVVDVGCRGVEWVAE